MDDWGWFIDPEKAFESIINNVNDDEECKSDDECKDRYPWYEWYEHDYGHEYGLKYETKSDIDINMNIDMNMENIETSLWVIFVTMFCKLYFAYCY